MKQKLLTIFSFCVLIPAINAQEKKHEITTPILIKEETLPTEPKKIIEQKESMKSKAEKPPIESTKAKKIAPNVSRANPNLAEY